MADEQKKEDKTRNVPAFKALVAQITTQLNAYDSNAAWQKPDKEIKDLDVLLNKLEAQAHILEVVFSALALPDLDDRGHEKKPVNDFLGRTRETANRTHAEYKTELKDYLSGSVKETDFSAIKAKLTKTRSASRVGYELATAILEDVTDARQALEMQRQLYADLHGSELDEEIKKEQDRIKKTEERIKTLQVKKSAKGKRKIA